MSENIIAALIAAGSGLIGVTIGAVIAWLTAKRAAQQSLAQYRGEAVRDAAPTTYQPLYAAITTLETKNTSNLTPDELRECCVQFNRDIDALTSDGNELYIEDSILADLKTLQTFISQSLAASEPKVRYGLTGPGMDGLFTDGNSNVITGEKAERFFSLPDISQQEPSQYNIIITEVVEAPMESEAFAWGLRRHIERLKTQVRQRVHV